LFWFAAIKVEDCVIGQYTASDDGKNPGYTEDETVPDDSRTATYATLVLYIRNPRWDGVPFIIRSGKGLNETKAEVRIQYKSPPGSCMIFPPNDEQGTCDEPVPRNELVIRLQPNEAIYMKTNVKEPGLATRWTQVELDLDFKSRYPSIYSLLPDAYTKLILQVMRGENSQFVREDELRSAWRIFTPLLHAIDNGELDPIPYKFGSRGPKEHDEIVEKHGFIRSSDYSWNPPAIADQNGKKANL
jgi:glucose-6-phosphate 1-dehydrogenase